MSGRLLLSFDDRHIASWVAARGLFDEAGARVTFFVVEADRLDDEERAGLRMLLDDGHDIGSHGLRHLNADDAIAEFGAARYLEVEIDASIRALQEIGASARSFAYPNTRRDAASDAALLTRFSSLRAGGSRTDDAALARQAIVPGDAVPRVLPSRGVDTGRGAEAHPADAATVSLLLRETAETDGALVLYAHDVAEHSAGNHLDPVRLRALLSEARSLGLALTGFDALPSPESASP